LDGLGSVRWRGGTWDSEDGEVESGDHTGDVMAEENVTDKVRGKDRCPGIEGGGGV
jgi:hypothetical protein